MYSPASLNFAVVSAFPRNGSFTPPPVSISARGLAFEKTTVPGPRYWDHVSTTGGGGFRIGAFVPLEYYASSSVPSGRRSGIATEVVRDSPGFATIAIGP